MNNPNLIKRDFLIRSLASKYWYFMALAIKPLRKQYSQKFLQQSLSLGYDNDRTWSRVAIYYFLQGDQKRAEEYLLGALRINSKNKGVMEMLDRVRSLQASGGL